MSGKQESDAASQQSWAQDTLLALCFFLLGDKIVIVSTLLLQFWDWLKGDCTQQKYVAEASLLALGLGLAGATILSVKFRHGKTEGSSAVIAGVCVGAAAGLFEVLKVVFIDNSFDPEDEARPLFMFAIYMVLFLVPALSGLARGDRESSVVKRLARMAVAMVTGFLFGALVSVLCYFMVMYLPVFSFDGNFTAAGDQFLFRPIALVWICSVWCVATFLLSAETQSISKTGPGLWITIYIFLACLCAFYYGAFEIEPSDQLREAVDIPVWLGFVMISLIPLLVCFVCGAARYGLIRMYVLRACLLSLALTLPVAYLGFGGVFGDDFWAKLSGALIYGFASATIPFVSWLSSKAYIGLFETEPQALA